LDKYMGLSESIDLIRRYKTKDVLKVSNLLSSYQGPLLNTLNENQFIQTVLANPHTRPWHLAFICKTSILTANDHKSKQIFARSDTNYGDACNLFTPILNSIINIDESQIDEDNPLSSVKMAADQIPSQEEFKYQLARFYALMEIIPPKVLDLNYSPSSKFKDLTGLSIGEFMAIGFQFICLASDTSILSIERVLRDGHAVFNRSKVELFLKQTQADYSEFRNIAKSRAEETGVSEQERYAYNPLYENPIIKCQDGTLIVPVVQMLQQKITWGIYYTLLSADGLTFTNEFGKIFEKYVGELLGDMTGSTDLIAEMPGIANKSEIKGPADWFWMKEENLVLIECKKSMLTLNTKTRNSIQDVKSNIEKSLGDAMEQLKDNTDHLKKGVWSIPGFSSDAKIFPLIITLGDFYFGNEDILLQFAAKERRDLESVCEGVQSLPVRALEFLADHYTRDELIEFIKHKLSDPVRKSDDFRNVLIEYTSMERRETAPKSEFLKTAYLEWTTGLT
jgi:hypothetical protein